MKEYNHEEARAICRVYEDFMQEVVNELRAKGEIKKGVISTFARWCAEEESAKLAEFGWTHEMVVEQSYRNLEEAMAARKSRSAETMIGEKASDIKIALFDRETSQAISLVHALECIHPEAVLQGFTLSDKTVWKSSDNKYLFVKDEYGKSIL